jgi:hypothetical protein
MRTPFLGTDAFFDPGELSKFNRVSEAGSIPETRPRATGKRKKIFPHPTSPLQVQGSAARRGAGWQPAPRLQTPFSAAGAAAGGASGLGTATGPRP